MNDEICWLVTVLYYEGLLKCAIKVKRSTVGEFCAEYPLEPENKEIIARYLPDHVRDCGPIVEVEEIFEVVEAHDGK